MGHTKAWELRQDGESFPVNVHFYTFGDEGLLEEANAASFIIKTKSKDIELAKTVIDLWIALLIEDEIGWNESIEDAFRRTYKELPYYTEYSLTEDEYLQIHDELNNYNDVDTLYEYIDAMQPRVELLQEEIKQSLNQQFCRVRFGGKVDEEEGSNTLWFRISSVGYNWYNTIYMFADSVYRGLHADKISVCRDAESDGQYETMFYTAKDGTPYFEMPISEFFNEEHGKNPVFSSTNICSGVYNFIRSELARGETFYHIMKAVDVSSSMSRNQLFRNLFNAELKQCVSSHVYVKNISSANIGKLAKSVCMISHQNQELLSVEIVSCKNTDILSEFGYRDRPGFSLVYEIYSSANTPHLADGKSLQVDYDTSLDNISAEEIVKGFNRSYLENLGYSQLHPDNKFFE